ncbi:hypothetical protein ACIRSU_06825 [Streptomyces sp. NPDC101160]|uniref:hypothetical protein n=1 Tax=Streptomyces sp. NPDC101160 TaxID=3366118 RepID=UPI0037F701BF
MPTDPFAVLNALLRAEAARQDRRPGARAESGTGSRTEPEPQRVSETAAPAASTGTEPEGRTH